MMIPDVVYTMCKYSSPAFEKNSYCDILPLRFPFGLLTCFVLFSLRRSVCCSGIQFRIPKHGIVLVSVILSYLGIDRWCLG